MNLDKIKEIIKEELVTEIEERGFICDSDNTERTVDTLIKKYLEHINETENNELFSEIDEEITKFLKQKYYQVGEILKNGNYIGYFTREKYYSIDEFNKKNNIED